jgi:hypothetical protein
MVMFFFFFYHPKCHSSFFLALSFIHTFFFSLMTIEFLSGSANGSAHFPPDEKGKILAILYLTVLFCAVLLLLGYMHYNEQNADTGYESHLKRKYESQIRS